MRKPVSAGKELDRSRIMHGLLESVQRDSASSQRDRADEFGVALGLVNAYLGYCVKKGLIRVKKIPAKRYAYYLTPKGFAEKSRLALKLISSSFHSFRKAREEYGAAFLEFRHAGFGRVVLMGRSELAEIAILCAVENNLAVAGIVAEGEPEGHMLDRPVVSEFGRVPGGFDCVAITDLLHPGASYAKAVKVAGARCVAAPLILGIGTPEKEAAE